MKGSCQCGNISYEVPDEYIALTLCYCSECQKVSTGVGSYSMFVATDTFKLITGHLESWERLSGAGTRNVAYFCPKCSNRIYHQNPEEPSFIRLKAGTLENASELEPDMHLWVQSAPEWVRFPEGAVTYDTQPTLEEGLLAVNRHREDAVNKRVN